jgi:hypothetical protein
MNRHLDTAGLLQRSARIATPRAQRCLALGVLACLLLSGLSLLTPTGASAAASGEIAQVGEFGASPGQFNWPGDLAVDPSDNSAFVLDQPVSPFPEFGESARVQKFTVPLAAPAASVTIATPAHEGMRSGVVAMAVDPGLKRLYVLKTLETGLGENLAQVASEIDAYSTEPSSGTLPLAANVPSGVLYSFPAPPTSPSSVPAGTLPSPDGMAVDPATHAIYVLGTDEPTGDVPTTFVQKIDLSGTDESTAMLDPKSFDDTAHEVSPASPSASGIAVDGSGAVYLSASRVAGPVAGEHAGVVKLSPNLETVSLVHEEAGGEGPQLTGGLSGGAGRDIGPQLAVSPDDELIYAVEDTATEREGNTVREGRKGSYELRGMSTVTGTQQIVYGGGTTTCFIGSAHNAIAAGDDGIVFALDEGNYDEFLEEPTAWGFHLIEFGPGGTGCPAPATSFEVGTDKTSSPVTVEKGQTVALKASASELNGAEPEELEWKVTGPEPFTTKVTTGCPSSCLETSHKFLKTGTYTVELTMKTTAESSSFGSPPPVTRELLVSAPAPKGFFEPSLPTANPGETVVFDASTSIDPAGGPNAEPTHQFKEYLWTFGDGGTAETTTPTYSRAFANTGSQARSESVTLTVVNEEGTHSAPTTQSITIQGTPSGGGGSGGGGSTPITAPITTPIITPSTTPIVTPKPSTAPPKPKPLTKAQKLTKALKVCRKIKQHKRRVSCEKQARARYGPKKKNKK